MSERTNTHKNRWLAQLKTLGLKPLLQVVEVIQNSNDLDWQERERFWIETFSRIAPLTNLDAGGRNGFLKSEETKAKIRAKATGRVMSRESVEKMKASKAANLTPEVRMNIALAQLGKKHSLEHRAKIAASNTGRVCSEETRRKIGLANSGKRHLN